MRRAFDVVLALATGIALAFLLLPLFALFIRISPQELFDALLSDVALDALWVSLKTGVIAHLFVLLVGTPAAYFLATKRFRGRGVLVTLVELPLICRPPSRASRSSPSTAGWGSWAGHLTRSESRFR